METIHDDYPGIEVVPPPGTVGMHDEEGEWMVKWKKIGDRYTIVEIDSKPVEPPQPRRRPEMEEPPVEESPRDELRRLADY